MTLSQEVNKIKYDFFNSAKLCMTAADLKRCKGRISHTWDLEFEYSDAFNAKMDELLDCDVRWYYDFFKWLNGRN